jgi:catechol 2,3-dioxygenase-like lactoylglutathione lyase family enzyme
MITSAHVIIYAEHAESTRAFFRDVLELPYIDAHDGWLLFALPPAELGIHPSDGGSRLMCDDVEATVAELTAKGVEFTSPIESQGFGLVTSLRIPGGGTLGLYQPRHATAYEL